MWASEIVEWRNVALENLLNRFYIVINIKLQMQIHNRKHFCWYNKRKVLYYMLNCNHIFNQIFYDELYNLFKQFYASWLLNMMLGLPEKIRTWENW